MDSSGLRAEELVHEYPTGAGLLRVLDGVNLDVGPGQSVAITGPSGSGKSTLLFVLGALASPTGGTARLGGVDPCELSLDDRARFRRDNIGFVFQSDCLLPQCTALENVLAPTLPDIRSWTRKGRLAAAENEERARGLLDAVGLADRKHHLPSALSGGEKQRVAIARALVRRPRLLLCDEPTGNLDGESRESVAALLVGAREVAAGRMVVLVTHDPALAARFPRRYRMEHGRLAA